MIVTKKYVTQDASKNFFDQLLKKTILNSALKNLENWFLAKSWVKLHFVNYNSFNERLVLLLLHVSVAIFRTTSLSNIR